MRYRMLFVLLLSGCSSLLAEVRLPNIISDHAVLQRQRPVRIWGWAQPGENVSVSFHQQSLTATADDYGQWEAWLKPEEAGGPYVLTVTGSASAAPLRREDILMGDVWIASGQSNMEMPLRGFNAQTPIKNSDAEIAAANHPRIRLLLQTKRASGTPMSDIKETWTVCTPDTAKTFSAVAYFFGREISEKEKVPVGLIDATWGGTPAQSWMSAGSIAEANLTSVYTAGGVLAQEQARFDEVKPMWTAQDAADKAAGRPPVTRPPLADRTPWIPSSLYNGMIAPDTKYAIKGAIWYQGEADASAAYGPNYTRVFGAMIGDWRRQWAQGDFPFLFVQLSSYTSNDFWNTVRDAQTRTLQMKNTGMAVSLDVGEAKNIHPADKQTVGARLAAAALGGTYGEKVESSSPTFVQATVEGGGVRAWFSHAEGLTTKGQPTGGFEVAGYDHKFVPAEARIEKIGVNETVIATAATVAHPHYIRYAWTSVVTSYLYNNAGLPTGTFTSEP
jgi:sialate O-acetylesterase